MAYDEHLAYRIKTVLQEKNVFFVEKKMFGGLCYMVNDKLCVGVMKNELIARIDPEEFEEYLKQDECEPLDKSGRSMKGFVLVDPIGVDMDSDLEKWVQLCLDFNPKAKASKKKK
ncbi:MAG: RNA methyltransferase [Salinivirgaceae bacterium]|nr:MAG: RNA methyltransferase [Salinivirgaceae bacterium]